MRLSFFALFPLTVIVTLLRSTGTPWRARIYG